MRDRFPLLVLGGLLLALLLGVLLVGSAQRGSYADVFSTYRSREGGTRALYLLASERGLPVERRTRELLHLEPGTGLVFLGVRFESPPRRFEITRSPEEIARSRSRDGGGPPEGDGLDAAAPPKTSGGGAPAASTGAGDPSSDGTDAPPSHDEAAGAPVPVTHAPGSAGFGPANDDDADEEDAEGSDTERSTSFSTSPVSGQELMSLLTHLRRGHRALHAPAQAEDALLNELGVTVGPGPREPAARLLVPSTPHPWTHGIRELHAPVRGDLQRLPADAIPLIEDAVTGRPVAAWVPVGAGGVVVVTAPALFDNQHLGRLDNAAWALRLLSALAGPDGRVAFDEYHHGFKSARSLVRFGARYGLHWALLQLLLGLVVWAFSLRRFGPAQPPVEEARNTRLDLLAATAQLYREGRHARWCASRIARWLTRSLAPTAGVRAHAEPAEVIAGLRRRGLEQLARGLEEVQSAAAATTLPTGLLKTARAASRTYRLPREAGRPLSNDPHRERDAA